MKIDMKLSRKFFSLSLLTAALTTSASANERLFTYTYEPETMPAGALEFENWVTAGVGRTAAVGQENFIRWDFRQEIEYGVTDNYTLSAYLNTRQQSFTEPATGKGTSEFQFRGISLENRYLVLNPAEHAVGLALYLEPRFSGLEFELEQKIILGQRCGDWKWALNLTHATEWEEHFKASEGEIEISFGLARQLNRHWSLGVEAREHNELPGYRKWENTALYIGPVVNYRNEHWWAALTVMPQIFGANFGGDPDLNSRLELEGHERWDIRLIAGFDF